LPIISSFARVRISPGSRKILLLLAASLASLTSATAVPLPGSARALVDQGMSYYREGAYENARNTLMSALGKGSSTPYLSRVYLMLGAVNEKLGERSQARYYAQKLIRQFPESRYRDAAEFALARICYQEREPVEALIHLLTIIDRNRSQALVETAKLTGSRITAQGVYDSGLESQLSEFQRAGSRNWLLYWLARQEYGLGHRSEGDLWLQRLQMNAPEARLQRLAEELRIKPATESRYTLRIGVILPLTGFEAANGLEFLRGAALALQDQPQGIELVIKDSGSSIKQGIRSMQALMESQVDLIIGELAGDRSAAMAALAAERNIPMLVPVSSDNGIASLGPNIYQMTSDIETRGAALAEYAFKSLGLRTFVSLAPADEYGQAISDAFANAIDKLGGTIVAQQWYYPGTQDVSRQFTAIRESASQFTPRDSLSTSDFLAGVRPAEEKLHEFRYAKPSRRTVPVQDEEEEDVPIIASIDGFFMPAYAEDIAIVAPQFSLAHIQAVPLGGDDWLHGTSLKSQHRYLDGAVFCAGAYAEETGMEFIQFKNRFRLATSTTAGPLAISGYDVTRLVTAAVAAGNRTALDVTQWIGKTQNRKGIATNFTFTPGKRVNRDVAILQYKNGAITRLQN
jgi:ABC-type branched-subunit amino acid transport system substrate-binding protein